ncbi:MAG: phosphomannomutase/phosphoglucomutase [Gemmatimonadota bacterium]|nr:phosphomannomutase/phosphoglucomutase [Gemmatimonadota bacterium]
MDLNTGIFREYDIRGIVGDDLTEEVTELVGRAFGTDLADRDAPRVVVGHDNRPSSPVLGEAMCRGLNAAGVDTLYVGTVPTPALYFAAIEYETDAGVQITGSHNPPEYNGIKMVRDGGSIYGDAIQALLARIRASDFASGSGTTREAEVLDRYVEEIAARGRVEGPVRMVLDCGNGAGSVVAVRALRAAGIDVDGLFCESDGTFPNHHPDPTVDENVVDLIARVRETGAALGVGLDGDADRIGAVTEEGKIVRGDHLLLLFALDVLRDRPGAEVVFDVKCSQALPRVIEANGGVPVMWKTGHSLIKERMKRGGSPIAGEMSGHICFADKFFGTDDAIYAAARLAGILAKTGRPFSELAAEIPTYPSTPELRLDCTEESKFGIVDDVVAHYKASHDVIDIDGARVLFDGGWALVRASNTQPVIVARIEADDRDRLVEIAEDVRAVLAGHGVTLPPV